MSVISITSHSSKQNVKPDPWQKLRQFTQARIAIGRAGSSTPTDELLKFQLAHAKAMDAVHHGLDVDAFLEQCANLPELERLLPAYKLHSQVKDRFEYLQRPDLGRRLDEKSRHQLKRDHKGQYDLAFVVADGLSSYAIAKNAAPFLQTFMQQAKEKNLHIAPLSVVAQGRVAIGDEIAVMQDAKAVIMLIGERPGLSSPDSMGLYLTWAPKVGIEDARRNCISNIRLEGLSYVDAVNKCLYLLEESKRLDISGIAVKDRAESVAPSLPASDSPTQISRQTQTFCLTNR